MSDPVDPRPARSGAIVESQPIAAPIPKAAIAQVPPVRTPAPSFTPARNAAPPTAKPRETIDGPSKPVYGDRAGEYRWMSRGRFDAWVHVGIAFIYQLLWIGALVGGGAVALLGVVGGSTHGDTSMALFFVAGGLAGLCGAYFTFRDRFRVNEAFSSRFCSGLANLSIMYVPFVAFVYGNYRLVQKLRGK